jgi:hypothetical protein
LIKLLKYGRPLKRSTGPVPERVKGPPKVICRTLNLDDHQGSFVAVLIDPPLTWTLPVASIHHVAVPHVPLKAPLENEAGAAVAVDV